MYFFKKWEIKQHWAASVDVTPLCGRVEQDNQSV